MTGAEVVSVVAGIVSIVLAAFAIWQSRDSRKEAQQAHEKTKDLLSQIDKRSAVTEERVAENFQKILDAVLDSFRRGPQDIGPAMRGPRRLVDTSVPSGAPRLLQAMESAFDNALREAVAEREDRDSYDANDEGADDEEATGDTAQ